MKNVKIIIDSTTDIIHPHQDLVTMPIIIRFGEEEYRHGVDLSNAAFYQKLASCEEFPTTSQVTPHAFAKQFDKAVAAGEQVVVITCSKKLSGTYQSAMIAAAEYPEDVYVLDSRNVALGTGVLTEYALQLKAQGHTAREIFDTLMEVRDKAMIFACVDTLEYLKRGGRISKTTAFVGSMLHMKPILRVADGEAAAIGKARGSKQANQLLLSEIEKAGGIDFSKPFLLGYSGQSDEKLQKFIEETKAVWEGREIPQTIIGSAVGVHAGPGAVAVAFFTK